MGKAHAKMISQVQSRTAPKPSMEMKLKLRCRVTHCQPASLYQELSDMTLTRTSCDLPNCFINFWSDKVPKYLVATVSLMAIEFESLGTEWQRCDTARRAKM